MTVPFFVLAVVAIAALILGIGGSSGLRQAARSISFLGFAAFGSLALASFYGMVALASRGGGVLLFLGLPSAFISWLFWGAFSASREHEELLALPPGERRDRVDALLQSQLDDHERTIAENSEQLKRFWITPGKRRRLRDEIAHSRSMIRGLTRMRPGVADLRNHGGEPTRHPGDPGSQTPERLPPA
ncbi:MAG: hypothetical protein K8S21_04330 [Gemmatimonadetes bacterium]|nr:hypothetical protein [Gemmatimonadota bacterium]